MKPLNNDDPGCNYTTSTCVIWQGPDLKCINLCKGDTVSSVVYKMATELCNVLEILNIDSYDLSCFNLTSCKPADFTQLFQFVLERICKLENCTGCVPDCNGTSTPSNPTPNLPGGCPDCEVAIAPCFYFIDPRTGDQITSLQLTDYVTLIGNTICSNALGIESAQKTLNNHETRIFVLEEKVNEPSTYTLPTMIPSTVLPSVPTEIDVVLEALELQFGQLRSATGMPNELYQNIAKQATGLNEEKTLSGTGATMSSLQGWATTVNNLAQAIGNIQLTINDIRQSVKTIQLNCCPTGCDGIELILTGNLNGDILTIYVDGVIPTGFVQCSGSTSVQVTDSSGASSSFILNLIGSLNNPTGTQYSLQGTPLNTSLDLNIVIEPCLQNNTTKSTCQSYLNYKVINTASCPVLSLIPTQGSVGYEFTTQLGNYSYNIQLWDAVGATMISNQIQIINGVQSINGQFTSLTPGTIYKIRTVITPASCATCEPVNCPFYNVTTNPPTCPAPEAVSAGITI